MRRRCLRNNIYETFFSKIGGKGRAVERYLSYVVDVGGGRTKRNYTKNSLRGGSIESAKKKTMGSCEQIKRRFIKIA